MKEFDVRIQSAKTGTVSNPRSCKWVQIDNEFNKITIDSSFQRNTLKITVETTEKVYTLTDHLLEVMLSAVEEHFSNEYQTFEVHGKD